MNNEIKVRPAYHNPSKRYKNNNRARAPLEFSDIVLSSEQPVEKLDEPVLQKPKHISKFTRVKKIFLNLFSGAIK